MRVNSNTKRPDLHKLNVSRLYSTDVISGPICKLVSVSWSDVLEWAKPHLCQENISGFHVSAKEYLLLWNEIIKRANSPFIYRTLGQRMANGPAIPVLFSLSCAPNLQTGLERFSRFKHLFGPIKLILKPSTKAFTAEFHPSEDGVALPASFSVPQIIFLYCKANLLSVKPLQPIRVRLPLPQAERENLNDIFGSVPEEGDPQIVYHSEDMAKPFISENERLWLDTEQDLLSQEKIITSGVTLSERIEAVLISNFGLSEPTLAFVCKRMQLSRSTLLRKLKAEGTTFKEVLEKTRKRLAVRYLETSNLTNQQISFLVGYNDPNAFHRAFKSWTGLTPGEMREKSQTQPS